VLVVERPPGDDGGEDGGQNEMRPQHHEYIYTVHEHREGGALPLAHPVEELQEPRDAGKNGLQAGVGTCQGLGVWKEVQEGERLHKKVAHRGEVR
jgi:hypothetical protein